MNAPFQLDAIPSAATRSGTILPQELPSALDLFPGVSVLSLDCFDTLLWRDSHAPQDIFSRLPGCTSMQRRRAERSARRIVGFGKGRQDVTIAEIYDNLLTGASPAERAAAIAEELAAEARHCFAFAPTVALMREARARGLQVIIVSDTYLDAAQLRQLIARAAGEEVAALVDRIFCSCTFRKPKALGLYGEVLRKLKLAPEAILHIGDNHKSDVEGVAPFGVNTLHLAQFSESVATQLRLEAGISGMIHHQDNAEIAAQQPHRATLALAEPSVTDAAEKFGLTALGPILAGFEHWLAAEAQALQTRHGGKVHWLFLMRDGHLPLQVHLAGSVADADAYAVEISRFTATAAVFASGHDIEHFVLRELGTIPEALCRQLLLSEAETARIMAGRSPEQASFALLNEIRNDQTRRAIISRSQAMAQRLVAHVKRVVQPAAGDTLMLVDLGYNGTVQNRIHALLTKALKVQVAGRYLLLREAECPGLDKRGFIDSRSYDANTLESLCANVAVLEQLCAVTSGSVIDYTPQGGPIRRGADIKQRQSAIRERVQAGCLRFIRENARATIRREAVDDIALWRRGGAAALTRLMYLPMAHELAVIESFEHDINLGTDRTVALFDREIGERGLRERGLFYIKDANRMYLPAELGGQTLAPKLTLFAGTRFGLPLHFSDFTGPALNLPVMFIHDQNVTLQQIPAHPTHDGWYMAAIPIGDCRYSAAVQFGAVFEWVQLGSVNAQPVADFLAELPTTGGKVIPLVPVFDAMSEPSPGLLQCQTASSFVMINPPPRQDERPMMVMVVFRPVAERPATPA